MATLLSNRYGKHRVRVLKLLRQGEKHEVAEMEADVLLSGGQESSYLAADNSVVVPTDTVKNTVQVLAHDALGTCRTSFAKVIGLHFLERYPHLTSVAIELRERRWGRMTVDGRAHEHSFVAESNGTWFARCDFQRDETPTLRAGIRDHLIMKTTGSGFAGYHVCPLTTLPPTEDRILATKLSAEWTFNDDAVDFTAADEGFIAAAYRVFAQHHSPSVQRTLYEIGEAALAGIAAIRQVDLKMPNVHFLGLDLTKLARPDQRQVFLPTDEPHGEIEAIVAR
jgi:urate oxidase